MLDYILSRFNSFSLDTKGLTPENLASRSKKEFSYSPNSTTLLICLPAWGQNLTEWKNLKKWAERSGVSFLGYEFPREILSDNYQLTEKVFSKISELVKKDISELKSKNGFKRCILVGISLGSSYGSMVYKGNSNITDVILVCPGNNLALNMWNGCRTQHLRKSYEKQDITLEELKNSWRELASENNMPAPGTKIIILYGKNDKVIRYSESSILAKVLESANLKTCVKNYHLGHYLLILYFILFPEKTLKEIG